MAKLIKSPGQRRKTRVMWAVGILAVIGLAVGGWLQHVEGQALRALHGNHESVMADITSLTHEQVEHHRKRRTTVEDVYKLKYQFAVEGASFENAVEIGESLFADLQETKQLEVWYAKGNPSFNDIPSDIERRVGEDTPIGNLFSAAVFVVPAAIFLHFLLSFIFVREPKGVLAEGFYKDNAWLDIDDRYLVAVDAGQLHVFNFEAKQSEEVQKMYQADAPIPQIFSSVKGKLKTVPIGEITSVTSYHHGDTFAVKYGDKNDSASVEFLSVAIKDHALSKIIPMLSGAIEKSVVSKGRLQSALPGFIGTLAAGAILYYWGPSVFAVLGSIALFYFSLPSFFARLFDPSVITSWKRNTALS